jgi:hydroxyacylglutathione hydrolase
MLLRQIFDPQLAQYAYLVGCPRSGEALIIDPERDIDKYQKLAKENGLRITAVAETHIHADFVSGTQEFARDPAVHIYLSAEGGPDWTYTWCANRPNTHLVRDGEKFKVGNIEIEAVLTPGHTPEHISFLITDLGAGAEEPIALATGDFLFMGDVGRPDLLESAAGVKNIMEPSARTLQKSLSERLSRYGDYLQILPAHGAGSACGKALGAVPTTTLGYERRFNQPFKLALGDAEGFVKDILQGQPDPPLYFATMKRVNRDGVPVTGGVPKASKLELSAFRNLLADPSVVMLDTRDSRQAFHESHTPRAVSAPLHSSLFSNSAGSFIGEQDRYVLIVEHPEDAVTAMQMLYRIGLDRVQGWIPFDEVKAAGLCAQRISSQSIQAFRPDTIGPEGAIIDVRTTAEYQSGHFPGAVSLPYTRMKERLQEVPAGKKLYVHCAKGGRASVASSFLEAKGFDVVHLDGDVIPVLHAFSSSKKA